MKTSLSLTDLEMRLNPIPPKYEAEIHDVNEKVVKTLKITL
jgi:hypothetical protein